MSKPWIWAAVLEIVLLGASVCVPTARAIRPAALEFEPLRWDPPVSHRIVLGNGLVVHMLEDDEVPLVEVSVYVRTGSVFEPAEKSGLARLVGKALRHGGTACYRPDEVDRILERTAAEFEVYMRAGYCAISLSLMKKDADEGLGLLAEVLKSPAFDEARVELFKEKRLEEIRRRYDQPTSVATIEFRKLVYGEESPWARTATEETVSGLRREDVVEFHRRYFRPNNAMVSICGDLGRQQMMEKIETAFGDWEPAAVAFPEIPALKKQFVPSVNYIDRDISLSYIRVGHLGQRLHDPNEFAVDMMSFILGGGGFLSRLTREVRSRRGLAYSIQSRFEPEEDLGLFEVMCEADAAKTHQTLTVILEIIRGMAAAPPTPLELAKAKDARINEFVFAFDSRAKIVRQAAWLEFEGYPQGYLESWVDRVRAVTVEDVWRAARSYLHPEGLTILVVGDERSFDRPLSDLGEVNRIEVD